AATCLIPWNRGTSTTPHIAGKWPGPSSKESSPTAAWSSRRGKYRPYSGSGFQGPVNWRSSIKNSSDPLPLNSMANQSTPPGDNFGNELNGRLNFCQPLVTVATMELSDVTWFVVKALS